VALEVVWSLKSERDFVYIFKYLVENWSEFVAKRFVKKTFAVIDLISKSPLMFPSSKTLQMRRAVITKHNTLYYYFKNDHVYIVTIFDNRQHPKKRPM
jgi:plasmid stabilization system protein ParE